MVLEAKKRTRLGLKPGKDGGSNKENGTAGSFDHKLPKGIVPKYTEGDDIDKWFSSFERACKMRKLGKHNWGIPTLGVVSSEG